MVNAAGPQPTPDRDRGKRAVGGMFLGQARRDLGFYAILCFAISVAIVIFALFDSEGDLVGAILFAGFAAAFGLAFSLAWWLLRRGSQPRGHN